MCVQTIQNFMSSDGKYEMASEIIRGSKRKKNRRRDNKQMRSKRGKSANCCMQMTTAKQPRCGLLLTPQSLDPTMEVHIIYGLVGRSARIFINLKLQPVVHVLRLFLFARGLGGGGCGCREGE